MDKATEEYYSNYFMLFNQAGWKQLKDELLNQAGVINNIEFTKDSEDLFRRKGQLNVIASILNLEETILRAHEEASSANV